MRLRSFIPWNICFQFSVQFTKEIRRELRTCRVCSFHINRYWFVDRITMRLWCARYIQYNPKHSYIPTLISRPPLKGHGNETDFLGFLQKSVRHRFLTLHFEPFRFGLSIRGDIRNRKTTPRFAESGSRPECL